MVALTTGSETLLQDGADNIVIANTNISNSQFVGYIYELFYTKNSHSTFEIEEINQYFRDKWGYNGYRTVS